MDFQPTPEHRKLQETARRLGQDFATRAAQHDREISAPTENYEALKKEGFYGLTVPKEMGGLGAGYSGYVLVAEEISQGCPSTGLTFNMHAMILPLMMGHPQLSPEKCQQLVDIAVCQQKLIAASLSEPGTSSMIATLTFLPSAQSSRVPGGYKLRGRKCFLSMIESSDYAMVFAHPEENPNPLAANAFLVPVGSEGMHIENVWNTLGMRGTRSNDVVLDDCFVPDENVICPIDNYLNFMERAIQWGCAYTAVYLGIAASAYRTACETLRDRVPRGFSQPMSYHPDVRRRVAEMSVDLEAARLLLHKAAWMADTEGMTPATFAALLRAKYFVGETAARVTRSALNACGAHALFKSSPLEQLFRDGASGSIQTPSSDLCLFGVGMIELGIDPAEMLPPLKIAG